MLQNQSATCFESATLLCSLLLGNHYDAYCVSGYAVREMCLMDRSLQECPLLDTQVKVSTILGSRVKQLYIKREEGSCSDRSVIQRCASAWLCFVFVFAGQDLRGGAAGE